MKYAPVTVKELKAMLENFDDNATIDVMGIPDRNYTRYQLQIATKLEKEIEFEEINLFKKL